MDKGGAVYDVAIVGAGPAGCTFALALKDAGLRVALLDKSSFPRDKVCGDAIPARPLKTLYSIAPEFAEAFRQFGPKYRTTKTALFYTGRSMEFNWVGEAYTCTRLQFDNFLFSLVRLHTNTEIFCDTNINEIEKGKDEITLTDKKRCLSFKAKIVIGADGAHSVVAKKLADRKLDRDHYVGSVRAYFTNIKNTEDCKTEIFFNKGFLPSYLWIFPLPGNTANVGFGMLSSEIAKKNINIRKTFYEFIDKTPGLPERFKDAKQVGELEGFGLPLGSKPVCISGERFILAGDAASLIDPISGDGIGNAMLSGQLAAQTVKECFSENNFTADFISRYDTALRGKIGAELKSRYRLQRILSKMPFLLDITFALSKSRLFRKIVQKKL